MLTIWYIHTYWIILTFLCTVICIYLCTMCIDYLSVQRSKVPCVPTDFCDILKFEVDYLFNLTGNRSTLFQILLQGSSTDGFDLYDKVTRQNCTPPNPRHTKEWIANEFLDLNFKYWNWERETGPGLVKNFGTERAAVWPEMHLMIFGA